ncbi:MAG TPA: hypothetical protein VIK35_08800 [Verrucomicrobiae bacterium]
MRQLLMVLILLGSLSSAFAADTVRGGLPRQTVLETAVTPGFFRSWTPPTLWSGDDLLDGQKPFLC